VELTSKTSLAGEKFDKQGAFEWLKEASRDCYDAIKLYEEWKKVDSVQNGEITKEEYCEGYCPHFPCHKCPLIGTEDCEYCEPSCPVGGGMITCPLNVRPSFIDVCYHTQQCYEKLLKGLIVAKEQRPPKTHDLKLLLNMLPNGIMQEELLVCIQRMRDYDKVRYPDVKEVSKEEACFCLKFVEEALSFLQYIEKCSGGGIIG